MSMILCGDALEQLKTLATGSCRTCVTSPPYYGLRDYGANGQIGLEKTPEEYIGRLVKIFNEVRRVLADDGTLWVNIADTYCSTNGGSMRNEVYLPGEKEYTRHGKRAKRPKTPDRCKPKDLMGIPWMLAFALRADGWYLRQEIIWQKPNAMPESVKDRCTKSHESLFLLSKQPKYYFDYLAIQEPRVGCNDDAPAGSVGAFGPKQQRRREKGNRNGFRGLGVYTGGQSQQNHRGGGNVGRKDRPTPAGGLAGNVPYSGQSGNRNRRDVWTIATAQNKVNHFATFPLELVRPCILAGSKEDDTVLDPFLGSGTTAVVATQEGREFVGIELNPEYAEMAHGRVALEGHRQLTMDGGTP